MKQLSFKITYGCIGVIVASLIGNILLFYGEFSCVSTFLVYTKCALKLGDNK